MRRKVESLRAPPSENICCLTVIIGETGDSGTVETWMACRFVEASRTIC